MRKRYHVHVQADHGVAHVRLVRWRWTFESYITVARIQLNHDDAEERLAEAKWKARDLARAVNGLERERTA